MSQLQYMHIKVYLISIQFESDSSTFVPFLVGAHLTTALNKLPSKIAPNDWQINSLNPSTRLSLFKSGWRPNTLQYMIVSKVINNSTSIRCLPPVFDTVHIKGCKKFFHNGTRPPKSNFVFAYHVDVYFRKSVRFINISLYFVANISLC